MVDVIMVGTVALDSVKTPFGEVEETLGGSSVYASVAASLFAKVGLVGVIGKDFPQRHINFLKEKGIDLAGLETADGDTFRWKGYYEYDMNQAHTLDTRLNVLSRFNPKLPEAYRDCRYVFLANTDPEIQLNVCDQIRKPKLIMLDTMNFWIDNKKEALKKVIGKVDVMLTNDAEARQFFGTPNLVKAGRAFLAMGPKAVIIKKGEHGAILFTGRPVLFGAGLPARGAGGPHGRRRLLRGRLHRLAGEDRRHLAAQHAQGGRLRQRHRVVQRGRLQPQQAEKDRPRRHLQQVHDVPGHRFFLIFLYLARTTTMLTKHLLSQTQWFVCMKPLSYRTLLRKEPEGGYTVTVPSLQGCVTYGETIEEAKKMARKRSNYILKA